MIDSEKRREYMKQWFKKNIDHWRKIHNEYTKKWYRDNKVKVRKYHKKYEEKNRMIKRAHSKVRSALKYKRLKKLPCEKCGDKKVHAHHEDYSKPLEVRWLCSIHHKLEHKDNKKII